MRSPRFVEHFENPRHVGALEPPAVTVEVSNPVCGDILRLSVLWQDDVVRQVRYKARGCAASIAAGSALSEWMEGKTRAEVESLEASVLERALGGLPPESKHAAVLAIDAVAALLAHFK